MTECPYQQTNTVNTYTRTLKRISVVRIRLLERYIHRGERPRERYGDSFDRGLMRVAVLFLHAHSTGTLEY
jgi:hypothetical protein